MSDLESIVVKQTLKKPEVHQQWIDVYRTTENERFFERAFDYIIRVLDVPKGSTFLDVGCGTGSHAIRLAKRGFLVLAVDFSESALDIAEENVLSKGLQDKIKLQREDLLSLTFEDSSFEYILCWGVLMHIPDLERAIRELARVLKPGGLLVISEGNMFSLQSIISQNLKRFITSEKARVVTSSAGVAHWEMTSAGNLMTRHTNIQWLIRNLEDKGITVKKHIAGQFTELYTKVSSKLLRNFIHGINNLWFTYIRIPHLSFGNIMILRKEK